MSITKTYLSKDKLSLYDTKLKAKMLNDDASTLNNAKIYTDTELSVFAIEVDTAVDALTDMINEKANKTHTHTKSDITNFPHIPTKTSELINDSNFITSELPSVTTNNNGDFLRVVNGSWAASTVLNAEEVGF